MRQLILVAAFAAGTALVPTAASAAPAVLIVDLEKVMSECTACRAASTAIQAQISSGQSRAQTLDTQLKTEAQAIETAARALNGKEPDAALKKRASDFQQRQQAAQAELASKEQQIESIRANVQQQLGNKIVAIAEQVRARHTADIVIGKNATLASTPGADVTGEVLAALNQQLPAVSVTPLPQNRSSGR